jgi:glucose/mannose-6-phosphate isomerase
MVVGALECAAAAGVAPLLRDEIEGTEDVLASLAEDPEPGGVAGALLNTIPVVHGAELTAPAARRWKTQLNENAKVAAFASELPEANHNEIEGWEHGRELGSLSAVFLEDPGARDRIKRRAEIYADTLKSLGAPVVRVQARGETPVARVLSLVALGDLASVRLADLAGVEATPVEAIESFKRSLD